MKARDGRSEFLRSGSKKPTLFQNCGSIRKDNLIKLFTMRIKFTSALVMILAVLLSGCLQDECTETRTFVQYEPVYKSKDQLEAPVSVESGRDLENPGIIYSYGTYLLVNEFRQGIHVINNADPSNPINEAFLRIEGNEHFAVINNRLQANKYNQLLTIDITDVKNPIETSRVRNVFSEIYEDPGRGYLVYYRQTDRQMVLDCSEPNFNSLRWDGDDGSFWGLVDFRALNSADLAVPSPGGNNGGVGTGGSTARFTIASNHLYIVSDYDMKVFDLVDPSVPALRNTINLGWGIETIYPFKDKLFIGSNSGMQVYNISNPSDPLFQSTFDHARACDPVVADDETAYVTLRDGSTCEGFDNQLEMIDVSNVLAPTLIAVHKMDNPHGLALDGNILYVCEGDFGFKVLDVSERGKAKELANEKNLVSTDVIAFPDDRILVVGKKGISQYDVTNPKKMKLLSQITVNNPTR